MVPAANFTQVTRTGALAEETCYHLPQDPVHGRMRRAALRIDALRARDQTVPTPYIEAVDFDEAGVAPLFLTLRDAARGTHYLDVSRRDRLAIVDSLGNAMALDRRGVHFSTKSCRYDVSLTVDGLYARLAALSGQACAKGVREREREQRERLAAQRDGAGPDDNGGGGDNSTAFRLAVGDSECGDAGDGGRWLFDCAFPGPEAAAARCRRGVAADVLRFLFVAPFGGACPDPSTVVTTLEASSRDFLTPATLRAELVDGRALDAADRAVFYEQLWEILRQALSKARARPPGAAAALLRFADAYAAALAPLPDDACAVFTPLRYVIRIDMLKKRPTMSASLVQPSWSICAVSPGRQSASVRSGPRSQPPPCLPCLAPRRYAVPFSSAQAVAARVLTLQTTRHCTRHQPRHMHMLHGRGEPSFRYSIPVTHTIPVAIAT